MEFENINILLSNLTQPLHLSSVFTDSSTASDLDALFSELEINSDLMFTERRVTTLHSACVQIKCQSVHFAQTTDDALFMKKGLVFTEQT